MTLTLRDINSADTGSFSYHHFSRISILNDTLTREGKNDKDVLFKSQIRQTYEEAHRSFLEYKGLNWVDAVRGGEDAKLGGLFLNTDSESVIEYSILSTTKPNADSAFQLFTPSAIGNSSTFTLDELSAQISLLLEEYSDNSENTIFLARLALCIIPQTIQLNQAIGRFNNDIKGKSTNNCASRFVNLCNKTVKDFWSPDLANAVKLMDTTMQVLEEYNGKYTKIEAKQIIGNELNLIVRKWSLLNYFPAVLIKSLNFKIEAASECCFGIKDCNIIARHELFKIVFVTMALEMSKTFIKMMRILIKLDLCDHFENQVVINFIESLLECTIESRSGEIMIGLDQLVKDWIVMKEKSEPLCKLSFYQWAQRMLINYKLQNFNDNVAHSQENDANNENDEEDDQVDLMFNKWDVGKMFVNEILKFSEPIPTSQHEDEPIGWLTIFDDDYSMQPDNEDDMSTFEIDSISSRIITEPRNVTSVRDIKTNHGRKRAAMKTWAHNNKTKVSEGCHRIKDKFEQIFQGQSEQDIITSVRYYNAVTSSRRYGHDNCQFSEETATFTPNQCAQIQRLTQKLYKREKRGKRKRDALKVIFS